MVIILFFTRWKFIKATYRTYRPHLFFSYDDKVVGGLFSVFRRCEDCECRADYYPDFLKDPHKASEMALVSRDTRQMAYKMPVQWW